MRTLSSTSSQSDLTAIKIIDQNMEDYLQFKVNFIIVFRDILKFLPAFLLQLKFWASQRKPQVIL